MVAEYGGFGKPDPVEEDLDKRFMAARCYETLMPANGRWLKSLPELKVVPDADFQAAINDLIAANPGGKARKMAVQRERILRELQDTLTVAARLLGFKKQMSSLDIGRTDPTAKTPDGRSTVGWTINSLQRGRYTMLLLDDTALFCEQYTADGRRVTERLMIESRYALSSKDDNLNPLKGSVWKEVARVPNALIEEAKAVSKDGNILAAAEMVCTRQNDHIVQLFVTCKTESGAWRFMMDGDKAMYILYALKDRIIVEGMTLHGVKLEPLTISLDEVQRYKATTWFSG